MSATPDTARQATAPAPPRLYRSSDGRVLAGVARGLADHLGVDVLVVRLAFVLLAAAGGAGVATYGLFWVFAPQNPYEAEAPRDRERDLTMLLALGSLTVGGPAAALGAGHGVAAGPGRPAGRGGRRRQHPLAAGRRRRAGPLAGGHRHAPVQRRGAGRRRHRAGGRRRRGHPVGPANLDGTAGGLMAALVVAAGLALVSSPWWVRMARDLAAERSARIREQERAEVAAHVHDSVLHTLTLIQRHVDDPREVTRLARAQERELRGWLYRPAPDATQHLAAALERGGRRGRGRARRRHRGRRGRRLRARRPARRRCATRPGRRWSTRRSTPAARPCRSTPRSSRTRSPCSSGTAGRASTRTPSPRTGSACDSRCAAGWTATAARPRSAPPPATGTEVQLEMPRQTRSAP